MSFHTRLVCSHVIAVFLNAISVQGMNSARLDGMLIMAFDVGPIYGPGTLPHDLPPRSSSWHPDSQNIQLGRSTGWMMW